MSEVNNLEVNDAQELVEFVYGDSLQVPQNLDKMMTNLYQKLQMTLGYSMAKNVKRQMKLANFIEKVEDELFDVSDETISSMDPEQLQDLYKQATKTLTEMNEFQRRFLAQNKDTLVGERTQQEELASQLMALSPQKLDSIMKIIRGESELELNETLEEV